MCALLTKLATAEQRKASWPLLTAGRGICLATVVASPVIQRTGVISIRLARDTGLTSTERSGGFSGNVWELWDEVFPLGLPDIFQCHS